MFPLNFVKFCFKNAGYSMHFKFTNLTPPFPLPPKRHTMLCTVLKFSTDGTNCLLTLTMKLGTGISLICWLVTVTVWVGTVNVPVGMGQSHGTPLASISLSHLLNISPRNISQKLSYVLKYKNVSSYQLSKNSAVIILNFIINYCF